MTNNIPELINIKQVVAITTLSQATIYRLIRKGVFPGGYLITPNRKVWKKNEVVEALNEMLGEPCQ